MVNKVLVDYLRMYKDKFPIDALKKEVLSKGYTEDEVDEVMSLLEPVKKSDVVLKSSSTPLNNFKVNHELESLTVNEHSGFSWSVFFGIIGILLACGIIGIIILNYMGYDIFGFNIFGL